MADDVNVNTGTTAGSRTYANLLAAGFPIMTRVFVLESGMSVVLGEVCSKNTSSAKIRSYELGAGGGDGTAYCIALEAIDASSGDKRGTFLTSGAINKNQIVFGDTDSTADDEGMYDNLRTVGIHLVDSVAS